MKMKSSIRDPKRRGECVELQFMARAAAHGFTVAKPHGDSSRYDVIVEHAGRLLRVQVKSTSHFNGRVWRCGTFSCSHRNGRTRIHAYTRDEVDFFAIYIVPEDAWYIIPITAVANLQSAVNLAPRDPTNRYAPYLEAWSLLRQAPT